MRSVPHRVVCLLGLDDGAFPRQTPRDGDNLLLDDPPARRPRSRAPRIASCCSTRCWLRSEALIITYSGNDERTNAPLPPAVPVGELLDAIDATARVAPAGSAATGHARGRGPPSAAGLRPAQLRDRDRIRRVPPTAPGASTRPRSRARARSSRRATSRQPFLPEPLPPATGERRSSRSTSWSRSSSGRCARSCASGSASRPGATRTRSTTPCRSSSTASRAGASASGCWTRCRAGVDPRDAYRAEIARGTLPPGALGAPVIQSILPTAKAACRHRRRVRAPVSDSALGADQRHARRRRPADRHGRRHPRPRRAAGQLLTARTRASGSPPGCGCWR